MARKRPRPKAEPKAAAASTSSAAPAPSAELSRRERRAQQRADKPARSTAQSSQHATHASADARAHAWLPRWLTVLLFCSAVGAVVAVRALPLYSEAQAVREDLRYQAANGKQYPYLIGQDSYSWVRKAKNYLDTGTPCDAKVGDECRDLLRHAPVGSIMPYASSLHIYAIAWLHRAFLLFDSQQPLPLSAFWLQVLIGALGVIPAWFVGRRLGGTWAGFFAALLIGLHENYFQRSLGADNDVWNVELPLLAAWSMLGALEGERLWQRFACALAAGVIMATHAAIWSGWGLGFLVLSVSGLACTAWAAVRAWLPGERAQARKQAGLLLALTACFVASTALLTRSGHGDEWREIGDKLGVHIAADPPPTAAAVPVPGRLQPEFPNGLRNVGELRVLSFTDIIDRLGGKLMFFGAFLGVLLLFLPWRAWNGPERSVLAITTVLLGVSVFAIEAPSLFGITLCLALPTAGLLASRVLQKKPLPAGPTMGALLLVVWLYATLKLSLGGQRFVILAVTPMSLAFAGGVGQALEHLRAKIRPPAAAWVAVLLVAWGVSSITQRGVVYAQRAVPRLHDAWWDSLLSLREHSPKDAIINAWWPYGYWIEYGAQRGVAADGSSALKHIPHWTGRALLAGNETEAVGLLRMLSCGSAAMGEPEGRFSAYAKLLAAKIDGFTAHDLIIEMASRDRAGAGALLSARGITDQATREGILQATHCTPRPTYLMLSDRQIRQSDLSYQGNWDLRRAAIAHQLRDKPEAIAVAAMVDQLGLSPALARDSFAQVRSRSGIALDQYISPTRPLFTQWLRCKPAADGQHSCATTQRSKDGAVFEGFSYPDGAPERGVLHFRRGGQDNQEPPLLIVVSQAIGTRSYPRTEQRGSEHAVLFDTVRDRVLIGPPVLIHSVFTQLELLEGHRLEGFEKIDQRRASGERVTTWRVSFPK